MTGRPINEDRQNAIALGLRTYTGAPHSPCGTTERYVSGGGCVQCARATATAQRQALRQVREGLRSQEGVDNDAAEKQSAFEKSIEDLL